MRHHPHSSRHKKYHFWIVGFLAFAWIIFRSGLNPKRISYPCQRAAMPIAAGWLLAVAAFLGGGYALRRWAKISGSAIVVAGIVWFLATTPLTTGAAPQAIGPLPYWEVTNPLSRVFVLDSIPPTSGSLAAGDASVPNASLTDPAIDSLFLISSSNGLRLHKSSEHPDGIVGANDVVVIKGNFQWYGKVTTSTDRIKGLIWQILRHPDGFTGEILVCDNTQGMGINAQDNNSEDPNQTILNVVQTFRAKGYPVYLMDWTYFGQNTGSEYSAGDYADAYMYDPTTRISYPKFHSPSGKYDISLRYGIWDSVTSTYDRSRLCIVNVAVLKHHGMAGATIAVKNWIGVMTTAYNTERYGGWNPMHYDFLFSKYALVARVMDVTYPRLSIVDAAWTSYNGNTTPANVVNTRMLLASTDPVAVSWYAAKYILTPISNPSETDPDLPAARYHGYLKNWWSFLRDSSGRAVTMDSSEMSVYGRRSILPAHLLNISVSDGWNILSVPANLTDPGTARIFPDAVSSAFAYEPGGGYRKCDSLLPGKGYWLKFSSPAVHSFDMPAAISETISVKSGWNMIGTPGVRIDVRAIAYLPATITHSNYFSYGGSYSAADTLEPCRGYWIKVSEDGELILSSAQQIPGSDYAGGAVQSPRAQSQSRGASEGPPENGINREYSGRLVSDELPPDPPEEGIETDPNAVQTEIPSAFALYQNYPNPFNPSTVIRFRLPVESNVSVRIYDLAGRIVAVVLEGTEGPGEKEVRWDTRAGSGGDVASGIYLVAVAARPTGGTQGGSLKTQKIVLLR